MAGLSNVPANDKQGTNNKRTPKPIVNNCSPPRHQDTKENLLGKDILDSDFNKHFNDRFISFFASLGALVPWW